MGKYSRYKYVTYSTWRTHRNTPWRAELDNANGRPWHKRCSSEREAAIAVDTKLIELGREPVNILKKKI